MKQRCKKCKSEQDYAPSVDMGRRTRKCIKCGNIEFEDKNPGSVNTTKTLDM